MIVLKILPSCVYTVAHYLMVLFTKGHAFQNTGFFLCIPLLTGKYNSNTESYKIRHI